MIQRVQFDRSPMAAGEQRLLSVVADAPIAVGIECFVQNPPPPGVRPCSACGSYSVGSGESLMVVADEYTFRQDGGRLIIKIVDAAGDHRQFTIEVSADTDTSNRSGSGALMA
jgi:hypothetical protein